MARSAAGAKIAFVKTAWSDLYEGEQVRGRHRYLRGRGAGHEKYNFMPGPDGVYYGYVPPIGRKERPPQPSDRNNWLVMFVAAREGSGPLTIVGWYADASFTEEYRPRPEYQQSGFETDDEGNQFVYCVLSPLAVLIPPERRTLTVRGDHLRRSPIVYARGGGRDEPWRQELVEVAVRAISDFGSQANGSERVVAPTIQYPDAADRGEVEQRAVERVRAYLSSHGYHVEDRQSDRCGYDLLALRNRQPSELHVEVKGTSLVGERFYITRNEYGYIDNPRWRLAIVSDVLNRATLRMLDKADGRGNFASIRSHGLPLRETTDDVPPPAVASGVRFRRSLAIRAAPIPAVRWPLIELLESTARERHRPPQRPTLPIALPPLQACPRAKNLVIRHLVDLRDSNLPILSFLGEAQIPKLRLQQDLFELVEFQMWGLAKSSHASLLEVHDWSLLRTQTDIQSAR